MPEGNTANRSYSNIIKTQKTHSKTQENTKNWDIGIT